jgi:hypothetical protein
VISGINGTLTYSAATGEFQASTFPIIIAGPTIPAPGHIGFFDQSIPSTTTIDLFVDKAGNFVSNGTGLQITGAVDLDGDGTNDATGLLLSGNITAFGADPAGPPTRVFDGLFTVTGGLLTQNITLSGGGTVFGGFPVGATGGFFLFAEDVTGGTLGNFNNDFSSDAVKDQESLVIPEPGAWACWAVALAGLAGLAWCRPRTARAAAGT